jgi:hypothetical protein
MQEVAQRQRRWLAWMLQQGIARAGEHLIHQVCLLVTGEEVEAPKRLADRLYDWCCCCCSLLRRCLVVWQCCMRSQTLQDLLVPLFMCLRLQVTCRTGIGVLASSVACECVCHLMLLRCYTVQWKVHLNIKAGCMPKHHALQVIM